VFKDPYVTRSGEQRCQVRWYAPTPDGTYQPMRCNKETVSLKSVLAVAPMRRTNAGWSLPSAAMDSYEQLTSQ
jgi:hypothetical protein